MKPGKYSMGIGDRFGRQGAAQLRAITDAARKGIDITPVWNKSNREHLIIGTTPEDVRKEADKVTAAAGFVKPYFVDADHINNDTVERFIPHSDFFTIDVATFIGKETDQEHIAGFISAASNYLGELKIEGISPIMVTRDFLLKTAGKYLYATRRAGEIYMQIEAAKGKGRFITEISMDEVSDPQKPAELFFILMMLAMEKIPLQTIAPKFSGRFNKGVDYDGDPMKFAAEFESDLLVTDRAVKEFSLPPDLKLSIHSGSDKFSIYPHIGRIIMKQDMGIHIKTAGTTWLEEVIGLAMAGGEAFSFVRGICLEALDKREELCAPYKDVIDVSESSLPTGGEIEKWDNLRLAGALRHIPGSRAYNPYLRQLIHVAYKLAAHRMDEFFMLLDKHHDIVAGCVYENLYQRHICRIFGIS